METKIMNNEQIDTNFGPNSKHWHGGKVDGYFDIQYHNDHPNKCCMSSRCVDLIHGIALTNIRNGNAILRDNGEYHTIVIKFECCWIVRISLDEKNLAILKSKEYVEENVDINYGCFYAPIKDIFKMEKELINFGSDCRKKEEK